MFAVKILLRQAEGSNSDTYLHPVKMYPDPFRGGDNVMVMCQTYRSASIHLFQIIMNLTMFGRYDNTPTATNHRLACAEVMKKVEDQKPWFGEESLLRIDRFR